MGLKLRRFRAQIKMSRTQEVSPLEGSYHYTLALPVNKGRNEERKKNVCTDHVTSNRYSTHLLPTEKASTTNEQYITKQDSVASKEPVASTSRKSEHIPERELENKSIEEPSKSERENTGQESTMSLENETENGDMKIKPTDLFLKMNMQNKEKGTLHSEDDDDYDLLTFNNNDFDYGEFDT